MAQPYNPFHTFMSLAEEWPHAVCWQLESLLKCQNYIISITSGKFWNMIARDRKVVLPLSEGLPNEKNPMLHILKLHI